MFEIIKKEGNDGCDAGYDMEEDEKEEEVFIII